MMYYKLKDGLWRNVAETNSKWFETHFYHKIIKKLQIKRADYLFFGYKNFRRKKLTDEQFLKLLKITKKSHQVMIYQINKVIKEILNIWDKYHLNDMKAGTLKQEKVLNEWKERPKGFSYGEDVEYLKSKNLYNDRGYKYGTKWLTSSLPKNIVEKIEIAINKLKK